MEHSIMDNNDVRVGKNDGTTSDVDEQKIDVDNIEQRKMDGATNGVKEPQERNYKIIVDSTADFTRDMWQKLKDDVMLVPLHLEPAELEELSLDKYYKYLRTHGSDEDHVQTSSSTLDEAQSVIGRAFAEGYDVIYLTMARSLSRGSYQIATMASERMQVKYLKRKITVMDSGCASTGLGLLVERLVERHLPYNEAIKFIRDEAPKIIHIFTVDNFTSLIKGGRFDEASRSLAVRMLTWKPVQKLLRLMGIFAKIIIGFYDGVGEKSMMPLRLKLGRKRLIKGFIREIRRYLPEESPATPDIIIAYAGDKELADKIYDALYIQAPGLPSRVRFGRIGKVMGAHCGETATAVFFWGTRKLTKNGK